MGRVSFDAEVYICFIYIQKYLIVVSFDTTVYAYLYVYMGRIYFWVALIRKYIYMDIYIWKYLACNPEPRFLFSAYILVGLG